MRRGQPAVWVYKQLLKYNLSKPEDCIEAAEESTTESKTQTEIILKCFEALSNKMDTIVTAGMKFFDDAYTDHPSDPKDYVMAVEKQILSLNEVWKCPNDNPCPTIATLAADIGSSVENMDKLLISPDYKELASALGEEIIRRVLPDLMLSLKPSRGSPHHEIATRNGFNIFLKRTLGMT